MCRPSVIGEPIRQVPLAAGRRSQFVNREVRVDSVEALGIVLHPALHSAGSDAACRRTASTGFRVENNPPGLIHLV